MFPLASSITGVIVRSAALAAVAAVLCVAAAAPNDIRSSVSGQRSFFCKLRVQRDVVEVVDCRTAVEL